MREETLGVVWDIREQAYPQPMRLAQVSRTHPSYRSPGDSTHHRQFRDDDTQCCKKVDEEIGQVIVCIMSAQEK